MTLPRCDCAIIGGGVAGLWARWALEHAGYRVLLIEQDALGAGQTNASQGILHRGVKYALSPAAAQAARTLEDAQLAWTQALRGEAGPDLRGVTLTATMMHLWTRPGLLGAMTGTAASLAMRSGVRKLERGGAMPLAFRQAPAGVHVWEVDETAVEPSSLVATLAARAAGPMLRGRCTGIGCDESGGVIVRAEMDGRTHEIACSMCLLAAGEGNEALAADVTGERVMQRRPLHMVIGRGVPCAVSGHCLNELSDKPRLTLTTLREEDGTLAWSMGGELAEAGVARSHEEQIHAARAALKECLGWLDTAAIELGTLRIDRAEGLTPEGRRPDSFVLREIAPGVLAAWPTKLALAPMLARAIVEWCTSRGLARASLSVPHDLGPACAVAPDVSRWGGVRWS